MADLRSGLLCGLLVCSSAAAQTPEPRSTDQMEEAFIDHAMTCLEAQQSDPLNEDLIASSGYIRVDPPEGFEEKVRIYRQPEAPHIITIALEASICSITWKLVDPEMPSLLIGSLTAGLLDRASKSQTMPFHAGELKKEKALLLYGFDSGRASGTFTVEIEDNLAEVRFVAVNNDNIQRLLHREAD